MASAASAITTAVSPPAASLTLLIQLRSSRSRSANLVAMRAIGHLSEVLCTQGDVGDRVAIKFGEERSQRAAQDCRQPAAVLDHALTSVGKALDKGEVGLRRPHDFAEADVGCGSRQGDTTGSTTHTGKITSTREG